MAGKWVTHIVSFMNELCLVPYFMNGLCLVPYLHNLCGHQLFGIFREIRDLLKSSPLSKFTQDLSLEHMLN